MQEPERRRRASASLAPAPSPLLLLLLKRRPASSGLARALVLLPAVLLLLWSLSAPSSSLGKQQPGALQQQLQQQHHHHHASSRRALLQADAAAAGDDDSGSSYADTACYPNSAVLDAAAVQRFAASLLGDARLAVTGARYSGACQAVGLAALSPPHAFAGLFPSALVLSTGDAAASVDDVQDAWHLLSSDLQWPGDARLGAHTRDAAVLELDLAVSPAAAAGSELVLSYLWGSEELEAGAPNPDVLSISIAAAGAGGAAAGQHKSSSSSAFVDLAVLPGGGKLQPPAAAGEDAGVQLFSNSGGSYRTAFNGFTQVLPSQGFRVQPGSSYTLRLAVADANHGLTDSVLMLPAGSVRLVASPTAAHGGPYSVAPHGKLSLNGAKSASASGAAILAYAWTVTAAAGSGQQQQQQQGGAPIVLAASGPAPVLAAPPAGEYDVTLEVWDAEGGYDATTTPLSVDAANVRDWWSNTPGFAAPPAAAAPRPTAVLSVNGRRGGGADMGPVKARSDGPALVDLDGSASSDGRGSRLAYFWSVTQTEPVQRAVELLTSYAQPARLVHSFEPGVYMVSLEVLGPGGSSTSQALVAVQANSRPTAVAGGPYLTQIGRPLIVDAGGSSDPDGDPLTFSWTLSRGGSVIGNYSGSALSVTLNKAGAYALRLAVRDDRGGVATASTEINAVHELPPPPPPLPAPAPAAAPVSQPIRTAAALPQPPLAPPAKPVPVPGARVRAAGLPGLPAEPAALPGGSQQYSGYPALQQYQQGAQLAVPQQQQQPAEQQQQQPQPSPEQLAAEAQATYMQQQALLMQQRAQEQRQQQALLLQQQAAAMPAPAATPAAVMPAATSPDAAQLPMQQQPQQPQQQPGPAMCLYSRQAGATPLTAQLNPSAETFIAPCATNDPAAAAGVAGAQAPPPAGAEAAAPPAAEATSAATPPPTAAAAAGAVPAPPLAPASDEGAAAGGSSKSSSTAAISSPDAFTKSRGAATQVFLDGAGSAAAAGRSLVAFRWTVKRRPDGSVVTTVDGARTPVWLAPGEYMAALQVTDTSGQTADAARDFAVGDAAATQAVISSPQGGFVELGSDGGSDGTASVQLGATGSTAGPGRSIVSYSWQVLRLPDNAAVATATGPAASVKLPGGSYGVQLTVLDTSGSSATASKAVAIGARGSSGATAVIAWPPLVVQAPSPAKGSSSTAGATTKVALDATGSAASVEGSSITQYVWAVLRLPDRQPVANATGRLASVELAPGQHEVGLLVVDDAGRSATARKTITVGGSAGGGGGTADGGSGKTDSGSSNNNRPPVVPQALNLTASSGGVLAISGVSDPDGDKVALSWSLMHQASGRTVSGKGGRVALDGVRPGHYSLLITADDSRGGHASGMARVEVTGARRAAAAAQGAAVKQARPASGSGPQGQAASTEQQTKEQQQAAAAARSKAAAAAAAAARAASIAPVFSGVPKPRKLPVLELPQGAVLELDAAAFTLLPPGQQPAEAYAWQMQQRGTGEQVAAATGRMGRFELASLDAYNIRLAATDRGGGQHVSTGSVRVQEPRAEDGLALADAAAGISGRCGPFKARQFEAAVLSCPELAAAASQAPGDALHWAWRLTPIAKLSSAAGGESAMQLSAGRSATFAGLAPGLYRVELALGLGGPPSSSNTVYFLATSLQVTPVRSLTLELPAQPVCASQPVALQAPALTLAPGAAQPTYTWRAKSQALTPQQQQQQQQRGAGTGEAGQLVQGSGRAFNFTTRPGDVEYSVSMQAQLPDGTQLTGSGRVRVKPCIACRSERVTVRLPAGSCQASAAQAALLLAGPVPSGVQLRWGDGTVTTPGLRNATVLARAAAAAASGAPGSSGSAASEELQSSCTALVEFRDEQPPAIRRLHPNGVCLSPANGKWACWAPQELVAISDNCQQQQQQQAHEQAALAYKLSCTRSRSDCKVLPDGRACVRAAAAGQVVELTVVARDASNNVAEPVEVLVRVSAPAPAGQRGGAPQQEACVQPALATLPASAGAASLHGGSPATKRDRHHHQHHRSSLHDAGRGRPAAAAADQEEEEDEDV